MAGRRHPFIAARRLSRRPITIVKTQDELEMLALSYDEATMIR
jgi:hypothetical protein